MPSPMKCECDKTLLLDYAIGALSEEERRRAEAQVRACPSCALELESHRALAADLASLPKPDFPPGLEAVLVRTAIEAGRRRSPAGSRRTFAWIPVLCAAAGLAIIAVLAMILNPSNLAPTGGTLEGVPRGGRGATVFDDLLQLYANLQQGWVILRDFASRFAPVARAFRTVAGVIGVQGAVITLASAAGVMIALWRFTRPRRKVRHANAR